MDIKLSEKESFLKSFALFWIVIELFLVFIFYHYRHIEEAYLKEKLFLRMKNYALFFKGEAFDMDIVPINDTTRYYELYDENDTLFILVPFPQDEKDALKIYYPKATYLQQRREIHIRLLEEFILLSLIAVAISILFSWYVLKPLRNALTTLETFIKDIIHDLNTPLTSILINLKMMDKNEEVESIAKSAKTIAMLHKNLDTYLKESIIQREKFPLDEVIQEQVAFFSSIYTNLNWEINVAPNVILHTDKNAFSRIVYNLLSNACKHNVTNGYVKISYRPKVLTFQNPTYGIDHPDRLFERFYKESERGLGIGLHIVQKLTRTLRIPLRFHYNPDMKEVLITLDLSKVTQS